MTTARLSPAQAQRLRQVTASMAAGVRAWQAWPALSVQRCGELEWTLSNQPFPLFNVVLRSDEPAATLASGVQTVLSSARAAGVSLSWLLPDPQATQLEALLQNHHCTVMGTVVAMAQSLAPWQRNTLQPASLQIVEVNGGEQLKTWCQLMVLVYGFPPEIAVPWFDLHLAMGIGKDRSWRHFLAYWDGHPVGTGSCFLDRDSIVIANVGTLPSYRRRGIAAGLTRECMRLGQRQQRQLATLCSSQMGLPVYRGLGFERLAELPVYCSPRHGSMRR